MSAAWKSSHAPSVLWRSGRWSLSLRDDELADIRYDGRRVLRSVRAVVRDRDWNTAAWTIDEIVQAADVLTVRVCTAALGADIAGEVRVEASGSTLSISFEAVSRTTFQTNRTGIVVLHPPVLAGAAALVTHSDGHAEESVFPVAISPHQPMIDIAALRWEHDGLAVGLAFAGDVFEMEDQRNWTDASYKTYSRPLSRPFPYLLQEGERVTQSVTIAVREIAPPAPPTTADRIELAFTGTPFPEVGVGASTRPDPVPPGVTPIGSSLLVELDLSSRTWRAALRRAEASGLPLDVRLVTADADPAGSLAQAVEALGTARVVRIAAFPPTGVGRHVSDADSTALLRSALDAAGVEGGVFTAAVVGGVRSHFTELNREHHRIPTNVQGIVLSSTPLFHTVGTEQLVEAVAIQRLVAEQAVSIADRIAAGAPVHVGPITLRAHFNDVATTPPPDTTGADLAEGYGPQLIDADDARQSAPELAAWTIAAAAAFAVPGVASLSFFEEWGARGIRSSDGEMFPVAAAVTALASLHGGELLSGASADGLAWALGSSTPTGVHVLVANLSDAPRTLEVGIPALAWTEAVPVRALSFVSLRR